MANGYNLQRVAASFSLPRYVFVLRNKQRCNIDKVCAGEIGRWKFEIVGFINGLINHLWPSDLLTSSKLFSRFERPFMVLNLSKSGVLKIQDQTMTCSSSPKELGGQKFRKQNRKKYRCPYAP